MGLHIEQLNCRDFRSYKEFSLSEIGSLTAIVGPNAVGKTNLLEGIQLVTACSSFRNPQPSHLVREGAASSCFAAQLAGDGRSLEVELRALPDSREYYLNGKKKRPRDLRGLLPSVLFSPEDLELVKGGQAPRRAHADALGAQLSANYQQVRRDYEKMLRQKNRLLKEGAQPLYLQSINEVLASIGSHFHRLRLELLSALEPYLKSAYAKISNDSEEVALAYVPSWLCHSVDTARIPEIEPSTRDEAHEALIAAMESDAFKEHERRACLQGPQLDRIEFYLNGRNAHDFASQGQQRSLVLACKIAEVELIAVKLGQTPVLLLDDVMSELDGARREALFSLVSGEVQTFITATNAEALDHALVQDARIVEIGKESHGRK